MDIINYIFYCITLPITVPFGGNVDASWLDILVGMALWIFILAVIFLIVVIVRKIIKKKKIKMKQITNQKSFMDSANERETINKIEIDETSDKKE